MLRVGGTWWEPEFGVELPGGHVAKPIAIREEPEFHEYKVDLLAPVQTLGPGRGLNSATSSWSTA